MTWAAVSKHSRKWRKVVRNVSRAVLWREMLLPNDWIHSSVAVMLMHLKYDSWSLRGRRRFHGRIHRVNLASAARAQLSWSAKLRSLENFCNDASMSENLTRLVFLHHYSDCSKTGIKSVIFSNYRFGCFSKGCENIANWIQWNSMEFKGLWPRNPSRMPNSGFLSTFLIRIWYDWKIWIWYTLNLGLWFRYDFDTVLVRFWYAFDTILIQFLIRFDMV